MVSRFRLEGVFSVLPTAFHDDGALDLRGTEALAEAHLGAGVTGLTVLGVMGEAAELTDGERGDVLARVLAAAGRTPVIVGVSGATAGDVSERSRDAADRGVAALMVSPSATLGLTSAVGATAAGGLPIVIQDYPAGSGVVLSVDDLSGAAEAEPLVVGVKAEAPPTSGTITSLRRRHPELGVVGGLGGLFLIDELRAGATGTMTGLAVPSSLVSIVRGFGTDPDRAEREWTALLPLIRLEAISPFSLAARKEVWRLRGVIGSSHCRRAGARVDEAARGDIKRALERASTAVAELTAG
jgi:4-hydroxy-tetrahydrodipicolinate synthase